MDKEEFRQWFATWRKWKRADLEAAWELYCKGRDDARGAAPVTTMPNDQTAPISDERIRQLFIEHGYSDPLPAKESLLYELCRAAAREGAALAAPLVQHEPQGHGASLSMFRQGNWEHPDHKGRIVGWVIPNEAVERMGADAFCLPREVDECLARLASAHGVKSLAAAPPSPAGQQESAAGVLASEEARRAATRAEVLSDVDPVVLECWKAQGRKVGAMLHEAQASIIELQEKLEDAADGVPASSKAEPAAYLVEGSHDGKLYAKIVHFTVDEARSSAAEFARHYTTVTTTPLARATAGVPESDRKAL